MGTHLHAWPSELWHKPVGGSFTKVADVIDINRSGHARNSIDDTTMDDPPPYRKFMAGSVDGGQFDFDIMFNPETATHAALFTSLSQSHHTHNAQRGNSGNAEKFYIKYPVGTTQYYESFEAFVLEFNETMATDSEFRATVSIKVDGTVTRGTAVPT